MKGLGPSSRKGSLAAFCILWVTLHLVNLFMSYRNGQSIKRCYQSINIQTIQNPIRSLFLQFEECCANVAHWTWPQIQPPQKTSLAGAPFYEGRFLQVLFDRLAQILHQVGG